MTLGVGAFPVLSSQIKGGIEPGGSAVYISNKVPAAQQAAAWKYITFLDSTAVPGHLGGRHRLHPDPQVLHPDRHHPEAVGHQTPATRWPTTQLLNGANTPATAGAVIGPYDDVRTAILTAEQSMFTGGVAPAAALSQAESTVNNTISTYNQRLGVG